MAYSGPFPHNNTGVTSAVNVASTTFTGNVGNTGTITGALTVTNSRINGEILDSGFIGAGIKIDAASTISAPTLVGISITGAVFAGGISNAGTIAAGQNDILVYGTSSFSG